MGGIINVGYGNDTSLHIGEGKELHLRVIYREYLESFDQLSQLTPLLWVRCLVDFAKNQLRDEDTILV